MERATQGAASFRVMAERQGHADGGIPRTMEEALSAPLEEVDEVEWMDFFMDFLNRHCLSRIEDIIEGADTGIHYGVSVSFVELMEMNMAAAHMLLRHPARLLPIFDQAIHALQKQWTDELPHGDPRRKTWHIKKNCHARLTHLPANVPELWKTKLPRSSDVGNFIEVRGTVIRTGMIKMLEWVRQMECAKCKHQFKTYADPEQYNNFPRITRCPSDREPPCQGKTFRLLEDAKVCKDFQEIKIQEQIQQLAMGSIPRSMMVVLEDDLVDSCKAGDDVTINGIVRRRWRMVDDDKRCDLEMFMQANHLQVNNEQRMGITITDEMKHEFESFWENHKRQPLVGRDTIIRSICPQVYGMHTVKLALLLVMIGGVQPSESGMRVRGESHLLLVGDPGTGKSQFLKYAAKLSPRSVLTAGVGTTSAGLTVTFVKDAGGEWMLEAGALVLADGGVCCIDEFSSIRKNDQTTIHEAMEQQTLSVAKAGLVCKLSTKCTVIAATNPKIKFDKEQSLSVNTAIGSPLLSRFDLILVLLDEQEEEWDSTVANFIMNQVSSLGFSSEEVWSLRRLQAYISYVTNTFHPKLTPKAERVLGHYYRLQRAADQRNQARTTVRLLESLVRLAQAHARLMCHQVVEVDDAVVAVQLMEMSMHNASMLGVVSALHSQPSDDPETEFAELKAKILRSLRLSDLDQGGDGDGDDEDEEDEEEEDDAGMDPQLLSQYSQMQRAQTRNGRTLADEIGDGDDDDEDDDEGIPRPTWRNEKLFTQKLQPDTVDWNTLNAIESPIRKPSKPTYGV